MIFNYKLKLHNLEKILNIPIKFEPYTNLLENWNGVTTGWSSSDNSVSVSIDSSKYLFGKPTLNLVMGVDKQEGTISKSFVCEPNKYYMVSVFVRNNGVLTTGLRVGTKTDWSSNYFTNRLICVIGSGSNTTIPINLDLFYQADIQRNVWVSGFMVNEISEEESHLSIEDLSAKYPFIVGTKDSPSMKDLLKHKYHGSPFEYFLTADGIRITNYNYPLSFYNVNENTLLETHVNDLPSQVFYTFIDSVALMAMLEGDITRVSHTYPKMPSDDDGSRRIFPRVQFFLGFELSSMRADSKPLANNVTMTINIYVPITKVSNSVQDDMISQIVTSLMGELKFSAIRGSDYFREPEQLYVRQTQYIKDVPILKRVKT